MTAAATGATGVAASARLELRFRVRGLLLALVRGMLLLVAAFILIKVRSTSDPYVHLGAFAACMVCVYAAMGANARVWGVYIAGFILFAQLRSHADGLGMPVHYEYPIFLEKLLFFGVIPTVWLQERLYTFARLGPLEAYTIGVYLSYFVVPHAVALALWRWDRPRFKTYALGFLLTLYIGLLVSAALPTAPPWLAGQTGDIPHVFQVIPDVAGEVTPGAYNNAYQVAGANPVAAMPSLHAGVPWLMVLALWRYRWARWAALAYAASMSFAIVYLGEHYFVDAIAGAAAAGAAWWAARRAMAWVDGRAGAQTRGAAETAASGDRTVLLGDWRVKKARIDPDACNGCQETSILASEEGHRTTQPKATAGPRQG